CVTGYRRKGLGSLTPASFALDADPPLVTLPGKRTKNKKLAEQPLPPDVVVALRSYLADRAPDLPLWPRSALKEIVAALRHALEEAGTPYVVDGPEGPLYFDLHAMRHSYVRMLDQSGATLKEAMQLARHSDPKLTMAIYGRAQLHDLGAAVERLPSLIADPQKAPVPLEATGTEGNQLPPVSELRPELTPVLAPPCDSLSAGERMPTPSGVGASPSSDNGLRLFERGCNETIEATKDTKDRGRP